MSNAMLDRLAAAREQGIRIGFELCQQEMSDLIQIVLNSKEYNSSPFGPERLSKIMRGISETYQYYRPAWTREVETDYKRAKLDERLKPIWGEAFEPFEARYEMLYKSDDYRKVFKERV